MLAVLATAPAALADSTRVKILQECQDGRLTGNYSSREIRDALNNIHQYSDCRDVLRAALLNQAGNSGGGGGGNGGAGGGGGGSGGSGGAPLTPSTEADRQALHEATTGGGQPLEISGRRVTPGEGELRNDLPTTLIVVLALLGAAAAAALAPSVRRSARGGLTAIGPKLRRVLPGRSG